MDIPKSLAAVVFPLAVVLVVVPVSGATVPYFPSASDDLGRQGFVRVINHSDEAGDVMVEAFDDEGSSFGPVSLAIGANQAVQFNSNDLEHGNTAKGLSSGIGQGHGDWRLVVTSDLGVEVLGYVRTPEGFVTPFHDVAANWNGEYRVATFNPGSNTNQMSQLRIINTGNGEASVRITGIDDAGHPGEPAELTVSPGAARTVSANDLEEGTGLVGGLGDGVGKWRLSLASAEPLIVQNMLASPTGHVANLSARTGQQESMYRLLFLTTSSAYDQRIYVVNWGADDAPVWLDGVLADDGAQVVNSLSKDDGIVVPANGRLKLRVQDVLQFDPPSEGSNYEELSAELHVGGRDIEVATMRTHPGTGERDVTHYEAVWR